MSDRYSEVVRDLVGAFNRRDFSIVPRLFSDDIEFRESPEWPQAGVYRGLDAFVGYFSRLLANVDGVQGEVVETVEDGNRVLALLRTSGTDRDTGERSEVSFSAIYTFHGAKCIRLEGFLDRDLALHAWRAGSQDRRAGEQASES
jgi:ketosteroid isomerase-like protein